METFEILSWNKSRHECGIRFNLIGHIAAFAFDSGVTLKIDESKTELFILIEKYDKGEKKDHIETCSIIGNKQAIKDFMSSIGHNVNGRNANNDTINLIEAIEDLNREICNLKYAIEEMKHETT